MTKPVALSDETYRRLKRRKRPGESFSETIERMMGTQKKDPMRFANEVPRSKVPARRRMKELDEDREASWEDA